MFGAKWINVGKSDTLQMLATLIICLLNMQLNLITSNRLHINEIMHLVSSTGCYTINPYS